MPLLYFPLHWVKVTFDKKLIDHDKDFIIFILLVFVYISELILKFNIAGRK